MFVVSNLRESPKTANKLAVRPANRIIQFLVLVHSSLILILNTYCFCIQVCPQTANSETRGNSSSQRKLKRQTKFVCSSENILKQTELQSTASAITPTYEQSPEQDPDTRPHTLHLSPNTRAMDRSPPEKPSPGQKKHASVSIRKVVATSKFIGAAHRAKKQLRMQSRFQPGTFRYREEGADNSVSPSSSIEKRHSPNEESDSRPSSKRKVNFLDLVSFAHSRDTHARDHSRGSHDRDHARDTHARDRTRDTHVIDFTRDAHTREPTRDTHRRDHTSVSHPREHHRAHHQSGIHPSGKRSQKIGSPNSAFQWFPRPHVPGRSDRVSRDRHDDGRGTNVEELYQEYERIEKTRYAEMLKKAKSLRAGNLPFLHRKANNS